MSTTQAPEAQKTTTEATQAPESPKRGPNEPAVLFEDRLRTDAFSRAMAALDRQEKESAPADAAPAVAEEPAAEEAAPADTQAQPEATPEPAKSEPGELESDRIVRALEEQRAAVRELERQRAEYEARLREVDTEKASVSKLAQARKAIEAGDPLTALAELGLTYEDLTRRIIAGEAPKTEAKSPAEQAIEDLRAKQAALEAKLAEREQEAARHAALSVVRTEVPASEFPLLAAHPAWEEEIIDGVRMEWERVGYAGEAPPVTPRQIAERLEAYLVEETLKRAKISPKVLEALKAANDQSQVKPPPAAQASAAPAKPNVSARTLLPTDSGSVSRIAGTTDEATAKARALAVLEQSLDR